MHEIYRESMPVKRVRRETTDVTHELYHATACTFLPILLGFRF